VSKLIRNLKVSYFQIFLISFSISFLNTGCRQDNSSSSVSIVWQGNKAVGLLIPNTLTDGKRTDKLHVQLIKSGDRTDVLGKFTDENNSKKFEPIVPLTLGLRYEVLLDTIVLAEIEVPFDETALSPKILNVYPTQDTVPENLLKIFIHFSQPMVEGRSLKYLTVLKNNRDTLKGTFLDLQPELWNQESTLLTLWLDPGRIKRDLIPNKELGTPLNANEYYTLYISSDWTGKNGKSLTRSFSKSFVTTLRDDRSPQPDQWIITPPPSGTKQALEVNLKESLDYSLLNDAIRLVNYQGNSVTGIINLRLEETKFIFTPNDSWKAGTYTLLIEGRLEDLAGNNLNRPFDKDLKSREKQKEPREIFEVRFNIQ